MYSNVRDMDIYNKSNFFFQIFELLEWERSQHDTA